MNKITTGKFKGKTYLQMQEILRSKKKSKPPKGIDKSIEKSYRMWQPVSDIKRSFFVWKGKRSNSPKELEIRQYLKENNIKFYREVSFDCNKRFDFYLPEYDLILEYDGMQHFERTDQMVNDIIKETILNNLGLKFIRYNKTHNLKSQIKHDIFSIFLSSII